MDKDFNTRQRFLLHLIYMAMIFILTSIISTVIEFEVNILSQLIIILIISTIIKYFVKRPILLISVLGIAFLIMVFIDSYRLSIFLPIREKMQPVLANLINNFKGKEAISNENISAVFLIIVIAISLYTSIVIYRIKKVSLLLPLYLSIFLIYWYSFVDIAFNITATFLFLFLILLGFKSYRESDLKARKLFKRWLGTTLIYSLIIVSVSLIIPKTNNYIKWPWIQEKVYNSFPVVEDLRYYKEYNRDTSSAELFSFSTSGFSDLDSDLGGPLVESQRKVMTVESDGPTYLRGSSKNFYTGKAWESKSKELEEYRPNERINFPSQLEKDSFFTEESIIVNFQSFTSQTIFAPYKAMSINLNRNFPILVDEDHIITSNDGIYKNEGYLVNFIKALSYEEMINAGANRRKSDIDNLDAYLQVPSDKISYRTMELTNSIIDNLDSDYEKAIEIQNHLRSNYKYNLDVIEVPKDEEFIDHFLFQEQEGYCTYFATSMAIMLRLEGIPTRYIEGYVANEKTEKNKYQIRQKHAHTWVEAFIEPVGWMSFEPTAVYESLETITENEEENIDSDLEEDIGPEKNDLPEEASKENETNVEDKLIEAEVDKDNKDSKVSKIMLLLIISIFIFIFIRVFTRYLKYKRKETKFVSLNNKDKILYLYKDIINILAILGFPIQPGETHFEYANRISDKFTIPQAYGIRDLTALFVKIKYSDAQVSDNDFLTFIEYKDSLDKKLRNDLGKVKYLYRRYINIYFARKKEIP